MKNRTKQQRALCNKILSDKSIRRAVVTRSHYWFFSIFFGNYIQYETALFQREMFELTEDTENRLVVVMAFRGSGKSTIMNLSYTLWSILGKQRKKFVVIISNTPNQARNQFQNIRDELRYNTLLANDLGPFEVDETGWGLSSLVLTKLNARITFASRDQAIRGIRFWQHRPDLIICDDLEDSTSVQSKEEREQTYRWFMSEVVPAGDGRARIIVLGNLLCDRSLLLRLKKDIDSGKSKGIFRAYPLLDDNKEILWPGRYESMEAIEELKKSISDEGVWKRDYLLEYRPEIDLYELHDAADAIIARKARGEPEPPRPGPRILGRYRISAPQENGHLFYD
jgi:hypothetical protein